jgi:hypothetical protein
MLKQKSMFERLQVTSNDTCHYTKFKFSTGKQLQIFQCINLLRLTEIA